MGERNLQVPLLDGNEAQEEGDEPEMEGALMNHHHNHRNNGDTAAAAAAAPLFLSNSSDRWKFTMFCDVQGHSAGQREYNRKQRETLARFGEVDSMTNLGPSKGTTGAGDQEEPCESFAINISYLTNLFLFIIKVVTAIRSGSLAIVASALDSLLDLLAGAILWFTKWSMQHHNKYKYPIGKSRVQPVGIVVFAAVMATLGMQVLLTAIEQLIEGVTKHSLDAWERGWLVVVMGIVIFSKLCLYLYCRTFKSDIVQAYATDHKLDILTNSVGLAAALLADRFVWWIDPVGAMLLALYTISNWGTTVIENAVNMDRVEAFKLTNPTKYNFLFARLLEEHLKRSLRAASLVGQSAPPEFLQLVTYIAFNHHQKICRLDTVRAYMLGGHYFVEVDIELPEDMPLREAHDIGETLQNKLEALPEVERAYVHLDFECDHKPEHDGGDYNV